MEIELMVLHKMLFNNLNRWFTDNYGSRRGFAWTWWYRLKYILGGFREYRQINWDSVERLVFVCKGNICRSAYAEAVARSLELDAVSCGLHTIVAAPANKAAIRAAIKKGIDLKEHKTTPIMYMALRKTDLLIAMDPRQVEFMKTHLVREHYYTLLGLWCAPTRPYISDPYGLSSEYFDNCFEFIEKSVNAISSKVRNPAS